MSADASEPVPPEAMRASDADRQRIVDRLQAAFTEGRLDLAELDERTSGAYAAKTVGDLDKFTVDLPAVPTAAEPAARPNTASERPPADSNDVVDRLRRGVAELPSWVLPLVGVIVAINVVAWVVAAVVNGVHFIFPWWILLIVIWVVGGRAHRQQSRDEQRRRQDEQRRWSEQRRRSNNDWYDRYHHRSRGYYDSRYHDRPEDQDER